jgi:predicted ribosome quality control (RQC) complex YloA/Tae2 family protein
MNAIDPGDKDSAADETAVTTLYTETGEVEVTETEVTDEIFAARVQIEDTRAHMSETIDAIKEQLSPAHLIEEAKDAVKDAASETMHEMTDAVVGKAKDIAQSASDAFHTVTEYVSDRATPMIKSAKENLAPSIDRAKQIGFHAKDAGGIVVEVVRKNPLPAVIIGVGIVWLLMSARRQPEQTT